MSNNQKLEKYLPPVLFDLGSFEGLGLCSNGTIVARCSTGPDYHTAEPCAFGSAARLGCAVGTLPFACSRGSLAAEKKMLGGKNSRFGK